MEYKKLCERLENGYGKSVLEVSAYIEDQENQILYATAQSKELSDEYKTILRFKGNELKQGISEYTSLYDAIGFSKARTRAMQKGRSSLPPRGSSRRCGTSIFSPSERPRRRFGANWRN